MVQYIEAISLIKVERPLSIFLAGGITGCPDWQKEVADSVQEAFDLEVALINPRRADFPINDPSAAEAQIRWEHEALRLADVLMFWFPKETLCPITLYELGTWTPTRKPLFVGTHPLYARRLDVVIQTALVRPTVKVHDDLSALLAEVCMFSQMFLDLKLPAPKKACGSMCGAQEALPAGCGCGSGECCF